ncbi:hypothetical protein MBLNU230_g8501t1 [Neophaeotheca triangularis]
MTTERIFEHPDTLRQFISNSGAETPQGTTTTIRLRLLHALEDRDLLTDCRNAGHTPQYEHSSIEYLKFSPAAKLWREALVAVLPELAQHVQNVIFDLHLPAVQPGGVSPPLSLEHREHSLWIQHHEVFSLVKTLATSLRMRCQGPVRFGLAFDRVAPREREFVKFVGQLQALARYDPGRELGA